MNKSNSFFPLFILVFFLGCSSELVDPSAGKDKDRTEAANAIDNLRSSPSNSLMMIYKAASSNDIYHSQIIPNNDYCTALEKRLKVDGEIPQASESPSQAYYNGRLYIIHKGGATNNIYYSYFDGEKWWGNTQISVNGTNIQTTKAPAAVVYNNKLYIVYKGGGSTSVYYSYFDGASWKGNTRIDVNGNNIETTESPSATVFNNKLYLVYKAGNSNYVYSSYLDGATWKGNMKISVNGNNVETTHAPSAAVFNSNLYIAYKAGNSNIVYYSIFDGLSWQRNTKIIINGNAVETTKAPSATVLNNNLYIAYRAGNSEDIYYSSFDGQVWRGNKPVYGVGTSSFANITAYPYELKPFVSSLLAISPISKRINFYSPQRFPWFESDDTHIQGIQVTDEGYLISSSNLNWVFESPSEIGLLIPIKNGAIEASQVVEIPDYGHAGGIQFTSGTLAVAVTKIDYWEAKRYVRFYTNNLSNMQEFETGSTDASAVGFVDINETQRLVVVVITQSMDMEYQVFNKVNNQWIHSKDDWTELIKHPEARNKVQNINIFKEGNLYYLVGLRNGDVDTANNRDELDIYTFSMTGNVITNFDLLGRLFVRGANMRWAGGLNRMSNNDLIITSCGRDILTGTNDISTYTR